MTSNSGINHIQMKIPNEHSSHILPVPFGKSKQKDLNKWFIEATFTF